MKLSKPIAVYPRLNHTFGPSIPIMNNGEPVLKREYIFKEFNFTIIDDFIRKTIKVKIDRVPLPLTLWTADEYDTIGNYTQEQVEQRILEKLGDRPSDVLTELFDKALPQF